MTSARKILDRLLTDRRAQVAAGLVATAAAAKLAADRYGERKRRSSRAFRLQPGEEPAEGLRRIAAGRAEKAAHRLREVAAGAEGEEAELIHGARKDLKKLRAVARLLREELGERGYRSENARYREAGRLLSASRDAAVKVRTLEGVLERSPEAAAESGPGSAEEWLESLRGERDRADPEAAAGVPSSLHEALGLVEEGRGRIAAWPLESEGWDLLGPGLDRAYRRGRRKMRRAAEEPGPGELHEWRKRAKDLWYQLRIVGGAVPEELGEATARVDRLGEALGEHHDLAVLREDMEGRELTASARARLTAAISLRQGELAREAFELGEALYAEKPKRFHKMMRAGWRAWREEE